MKKINLFLLFIFLLSINGKTQTTIIDSIMHDGIWRNYRVYIPAMYTGSSAVPLVLNLHGYTSNAIEQEFYGDMRPIADTANFIIVHPNGTGPSTAQFWNAYTTGSPDDIGFLEALIDTLSLQFNVNANRIYSCGMSNGGIMSYYLACNLNYKLAAIGSVTGSMTPGMLASCIPPDNMPVIEIHGTADGTVPYTGGTTFEPIDSIIDFWASYNNCTMTPLVIPYPNISSTDGCTATEYAYLNGTDGAEVVLVKITGGGHTWPDAPVTIGVTNRDFSASIRLWQFFMKFDKSQFVGINEFDERYEKLIVFPNPSLNSISIISNVDVTEFKLLDLSGKILVTQKLNSTKFELDISSLSQGIYFISSPFETVRFIKQ